MGDYGATVIKIEPPEGDRYRTLKGAWPVDYNWLLTSRNKHSIAIDLKKPEGRRIMHRLAEQADVFLTNFIGDDLKRYEMEYSTIRALNNQIIFAHVTGYGEDGPDVRKRAFDATAWWASSGLMEFVRAQGSEPAVSAPGMGDHATSMSLFSAICAGLYRRERIGQGCYVSTSLVANGVWSNGMGLQGVLSGVDLSERRQQGSSYPFGRVYRTKDGESVLLSIVNVSKEWSKLMTALDLDEFSEDPRFSSLQDIIVNRVEVVAILDARFAEMTIDQAVTGLIENQVTHSQVKSMPQVVTDQQLEINEVIVPTASDDPDYQQTIMSPIQIAEEDKLAPNKAPEVGANSIEVLETYLELSPQEIKGLIESEIIATERKVADRK